MYNAAFYTCAPAYRKAAPDRHTEIAANRTEAAERTYAALVRTGMVSLVAGVGAKTTLDGVLPEWVVVPTGSALVVSAAFCFIAASWAAVWRKPSPDL